MSLSQSVPKGTRGSKATPMPKVTTPTALGLVALRAAATFVLSALFLCVPAVLAGAAPPPSTDTVKPVCKAPAPGYASCLGLRLVRPAAGAHTQRAAVTPANQRSAVTPANQRAAVTPANATPEGLSPAELHKAYALPLTAAEPQTVAIVDAYDDPHAEADLRVYDEQFALLPACTEANGCFTKVGQYGSQSTLPAANGEWSVEIATDIEVAHSVCQNCHIVLVEADTASLSDLGAAENTAAAKIAAASKPGALEGEISNSWGGSEPTQDSPDYNHPGIVITASAGDAGYLNWDEYEKRGEPESGYFEGPDYPASSPHVVAVGGTSLSLNSSAEWAGEEVWNYREGAGGGGCSAFFAAAPWQSHTAGWPAVGCGARRAVADVSADANPYTGVAIYDSVPEGLGIKGKPEGEAPEWTPIGGTSVASPIVAATFALAGGAHGVAYPAATLYAHAGSSALHDIVTGGNGECDDLYSGSCSGSPLSPLDCGASATICNAAPGYDGPTGVGTPDTLAAFVPVPGEIGGPEEGGGSHGGGGGSHGGGSEGSPAPGSGSGAGGATGPSGGSGGSTSGSSPIASPGTTGGPAVLTHLSLTLSAVAALNRGRPPLARVAFTFTLSTAARIVVTLARRVHVHGHWRWSTLRGSNSIAARAGANHAHISGRGVLPSGVYRLTLTPAHGAPRSLMLTIG
jgi:hypothetical protein